ncbi:hypothetical protein ACFWV4_09660 [Streptomyces fradiae]|uniref:hypothetical protein n=1 Tax=Streptomyces fradiae TaxID=1906 RepID=UPI003655201A
MPQTGAMRIPRKAARVAVLDADGAVFLFRYDDEEVGVHWAMPGGGLEPAAADEPLWPPRLPGLLAAARRDGPPDHPVDLR